MATKQPLKTTFDVGKVIGPLFTGGSFAIDNSVSILATTLGEDVVLTNPSNGENITKIEGVCLYAALMCEIQWLTIWCLKDGELVSTMTCKYLCLPELWEPLPELTFLPRHSNALWEPPHCVF